MADPITRRSFHLAVGSGGLLAGAAAADDKKEPPTGPERDYPAPKFQPQFRRPQLGKTLVQDFVLFAHSDLDMVRTLLDKHPAVANATMDWGGGDWESGLGGASHMGRRDIAGLLLERGARIDVFAAAMLGYLDVVKGLLAARPGLIDTKGPHGIGLHAHAKAGGKESEAVLAYLQSVKAVDLTPKKAPAKKP